MTLAGREQFGSLVVRALSDPEGNGTEGGDPTGALAVALSRSGAGRLDPTGEVLVPPDSLRRLASEAAAADGRSIDPAWEPGFATMLEYADRNGWIAADGAVRAHVEWVES